MTKGKPFPIIIQFCLPILFGAMFQQAYSLIDAFIVRRFIGLNEMGAVLSTGPLQFLVLGFTWGITTGFSIPISQAFGAGDLCEMRKRVANSLYLCGIIAVALAAITVTFIRPLLVVMQTPEATIDAAYNYIVVIFAGIPVILCYNIFIAILRALGDSKTPLYFLGISCVLNIVLDIVFIVVFKWGTSGVGWATVVSMTFATVLCLIHIRRSFYILRFLKGELRFCRSRCGILLKNGIPMALQFSITAIGSVVLQSAMNGFGPVVVSAVATAAKIQVFVMQPMEALGITMATYCAQNLGAGKLLRIKKGISLSMVTVLCYSVFAGVLIVFGGRWLAYPLIVLGAESEQDIANIAIAMPYIKQFQIANGSLYWLLGILFVIRNSIQGLGYSKVTVLAGVSELFARAGVAFLLVPFFGFRAICFANSLAWLFADILLIIIFIFLMKKLSNIPRRELGKKIL